MSKAPHGLRAGTSLLAVYEWLSNGKPATAQEIGDALHADGHERRYGFRPVNAGPDTRRAWALRLLVPLMKRGAVTVEVVGRGYGHWTAVSQGEE